MARRFTLEDLREGSPVSAAVAAADVVSDRIRADRLRELLSGERLFRARRSARAEVVLARYLREQGRKRLSARA